MSADRISDLTHKAKTLTVQADADDALDLLVKLDGLQSAVRTAKQEVEDSLVKWIQRNGDLFLGNKRYYAGYRTKLNKLRDFEELAEAMRDLALQREEEANPGQDPEVTAENAWKRFVGALSKNAFLIKGIKDLLGDSFDSFFSREKVDELKVVDAKSGEGNAHFEVPRRLMSHRTDRR